MTKMQVAEMRNIMTSWEYDILGNALTMFADHCEKKCDDAKNKEMPDIAKMFEQQMIRTRELRTLILG